MADVTTVRLREMSTGVTVTVDEATAEGLRGYEPADEKPKPAPRKAQAEK